MSRLVIQPAKLNFLPDIARIHHSSLSDDFLPSLGLDFLAEVYYPQAIQSDYARTLIALIDEVPVGFVTVAHDSERFTQDVLKGRLIALTKYALRAMLRDPNYVRKCLEVFWSAVGAKPDPIKGEIVFIAVDQAHQGQGIGKQLVKAAADYLCQKGIPSCRTKTLATNRHIIRMYEGMGWQVRNHFHLIGREYVTLVVEKLAGDG
jgi:ribosomal protein S18 acetylase RimI-like enzyme